MTVIAASTTAALIAGGPATVATALTVQYAASGSAVAVMAAGPSTAVAAAGGAAALINGAVAGAAGVATSLASAAGATSFGAGVMAGGATSMTTIAAGFFSSLVSGATTGAVAAVQTAAASAGGLTGVASASFFAGPIGLAVVGDDGVSWDCWKPVVMETSEVPSRGMTLRDLHGHRNMKQITIDHNGFIAENVLGRRFRLSPVTVYGILTFHATII
ncbi:hypothetical protein CCHR01_18239 [Colletotrichum chrysophilum]|uniref:Uncharacterized protein n=1 Tax=Colletotrichum chrysophilum TaxID=1836956 RepID=A0AAD9A0Q9_9PEZI|nr:hypothetical protein CCHR01_18239 [Colletotrichum chrysophilum]